MQYPYWKIKHVFNIIKYYYVLKKKQDNVYSFFLVKYNIICKSLILAAFIILIINQEVGE